MASVDLSPVVDGDRLWIMGYGCENGVDNANRYPEGGPRLKVQDTEALGEAVLEHEGTFIPTEQNPVVHERYVITPGKAFADEQASLCPGDSGGPVYRADTDGTVIVGVNAYYSFLPRFRDPDRVSYTNWHTRLDESSPWQVNPWLRDLGVATVETRADGTGGGGQGGQGGGGGWTPGGDDCARVVINEVSPHGLTSGTDEFVELYNAGTCGVSLEGFTLTYSPSGGNFEQLYWTGGASDGIAPGSYYTIGGEDFPGLSWGYGVLAQGIAKKGGGLAVRDPAGRTLDQMAYGEVDEDHPFIEGTPVGNYEDRIGYDKSAARLPDGVDTNHNLTDFAADVARTPGASNMP